MARIVKKVIKFVRSLFVHLSSGKGHVEKLTDQRESKSAKVESNTVKRSEMSSNLLNLTEAPSTTSPDSRFLRLPLEMLHEIITNIPWSPKDYWSLSATCHQLHNHLHENVAQILLDVARKQCPIAWMLDPGSIATPRNQDLDKWVEKTRPIKGIVALVGSLRGPNIEERQDWKECLETGLWLMTIAQDSHGSPEDRSNSEDNEWPLPLRRYPYDKACFSLCRRLSTDASIRYAAIVISETLRTCVMKALGGWVEVHSMSEEMRKRRQDLQAAQGLFERPDAELALEAVMVNEGSSIIQMFNLLKKIASHKSHNVSSIPSVVGEGPHDILLRKLDVYSDHTGRQTFRNARKFREMWSSNQQAVSGEAGGAREEQLWCAGYGSDGPGYFASTRRLLIHQIRSDAGLSEEVSLQTAIDVLKKGFVDPPRYFPQVRTRDVAFDLSWLRDFHEGLRFGDNAAGELISRERKVVLIRGMEDFAEYKHERGKHIRESQGLFEVFLSTWLEKRRDS